MCQESLIARRQVEILNALGLHLRPAQKFVSLAQRFKSEIRVLHKGQESNGKGIMDLALLAAEQGSKLDLEARGVDAEDAIEALVKLIEARFYENDEGEPVADQGSAP
jgi:phosphocarrier protein